MFILLTFWEILRLGFWWFVIGYFVVKYEILVEFDKMLYFQGFEGIFGEIVVIFDGVKSGENA